MGKFSLSYRVEGATWSLELPPDALEKLNLHVQRGDQHESVGQLYASDLTSEFVIVERVTKVPTTWSAFTGVRFDAGGAENERLEMFVQGLHCLGFWHTHPEYVPHPSTKDLQLAADHAIASKELFTGIIFLIVGTAPFPLGLGVWLHDGVRAWKMDVEYNVRDQI